MTRARGYSNGVSRLKSPRQIMREFSKDAALILSVTCLAVAAAVFWN